MTSWAETVRETTRRAAGRCEYCRMHQALQGATFHVDHVEPSARGGTSELTNLAFACTACNLHKSDRIDGIDPDTGTTVPLFNPRRDVWTEHFAFDGYILRGLTQQGRATIAVLDLNHPRRVMIRRAEELFSLFPP